MFDILILNGVVVDGTGARGYRADVGVGGERIDAIGDLAHAETTASDQCRRADGGARLHRHPHALRGRPSRQPAARLRPAPGDHHGVSGHRRDVVCAAVARELPYVPPLALGPAGLAARGPGHEQRGRLPRPLPQEGGDQHRLPGAQRHPATGGGGLARRAPDRRPDGSATSACCARASSRARWASPPDPPTIPVPGRAPTSWWRSARCSRSWAAST